MGYLPALGGKAAHLVSDLATVILNPISERERHRHHTSHLPEATEGKDTLFDDDDSDQNSETPDGPDTSSFRAFLMSFVPSSTASKDSMETTTEHSLDVEYPTLTPVGKTCSGRKGLLSRGKHSIGRIISKAGLGNLRQKQAHSIDGGIIGHTESVAPRFEMKGSKESTSHDIKLPAMSEPSVLLTEMMRAVLYTSLPVLVQGRNWMLVYSTWRHGISLSTLYRRSRLCAGYSLLIVGDRRGAVFGGLVEAPLQPIIKRKYQGTNDCFVFTNVDGRPVICHPTVRLVLAPPQRLLTTHAYPIPRNSKSKMSSCGVSSMLQSMKTCSRSAALKSKEFGICDRLEFTKLLMLGVKRSSGVACTV